MQTNANDIEAQQPDDEEEEADVDLEAVDGLLEEEDLMSVHDQLNAAQKYVCKYMFVPSLTAFQSEALNEWANEMTRSHELRTEKFIQELEALTAEKEAALLLAKQAANTAAKLQQEVTSLQQNLAAKDGETERIQNEVCFLCSCLSNSNIASVC